ncbi:hypothetical protein F5H01DRAFT_334866 [Linnemannia elongata]|nr:hypothetical protein F5H01DRAFT_334866 [Linnemannia elongata]
MQLTKSPPLTLSQSFIYLLILLSRLPPFRSHLHSSSLSLSLALALSNVIISVRFHIAIPSSLDTNSLTFSFPDKLFSFTS